MRRTFYKCPMCGDPITHATLYLTFANEAQYSLSFTIKCRKCKETIVVDVDIVPEFSMTAESTP